ncbi:unnamed protein product [Rhodiola kirilowii]
MSKSTYRGGLEVFDFDEDEELVQKESARIMKRFPKPVDSSPVTKYTFLERFGKEITSPQKRTVVVPIEVDSYDSKETKTGRKGCIDVYSSGRNSWSGSLCPKENPSSSQPVGCVIDKDEGQNTGNNSLSASTSISTESKSSCEEGSLEFDVRSWKSDPINKKVVVSPDSIMYENIYCTDSTLTFTACTVELVGSFVDLNKETFCFEWPVTTILKIESQWCPDVETAVIKLHFQSEDAATISKIGSSGVTVLKFTVCDSSWFQGEEAINLLDAKYKALWNVIYDINSVREEDQLFAPNSTLEMKNCIPEETSEILVFPKGDPDAVSIGGRDIELLQPETFINDTIIDFYMKYLMTQIPHEKRNRVYFFNSFFFRKLADLDKDSSNMSERKEAFQRVRKWTRNVNLFDKDYIFIPINFSLHWSLIIICHPGELTNTKDDKSDKSSKVTCILHMDSLRGCHKGLKNLFESYLKEEVRARESVTTKVLARKMSNIQFISLEVPQQQNSFDCGLFLLHFVERFLEHASFSFDPLTCIDKDWFPPTEVSSKRYHIRELIHKLLIYDSDNSKEGDDGNRHSLHVPLDHVRNQTINASKIKETCNSTNISEGKDLCPIEPQLIGSPPKQAECGAKSGLLTPELPDNIRLTVSKFCSEVDEQFNDRIASYRNLDDTTESGKENQASTSYSSKIINSLRSSWNTGLSRLHGMNNSIAVDVPDDGLDRPTADSNKKLNNSNWHYTSIEDIEDCIVEDSEDEAVNVVTGTDSSREIIPSGSHGTNLLDCVVQDSDSEGPTSYEEKDVIDIEDSSKSFKVIDLSNEADEDDEGNRKMPVKRPRLKLDR